MEVGLVYKTFFVISHINCLNIIIERHTQMDLVIEAELYSPSINEERNYVDRIPPSIIHGIRCPCGSRKDKVYNSYALFNTHIKTVHHQSWLRDLNLNKANHYKENDELKRTIQNQKFIISQLQKEINEKTYHICELSEENLRLKKSASAVVYNLIDMDL